MLLTGILDHDLVDLDLPPSQQVVEWMREDRLRLDAIVRSRTADCPRLTLGFHPPHGFSILIHETEASDGLFACRDLAFGPTEVLVQFSLVDAELWPAELFVDDAAVCCAIDHIRQTGRAAPTLTWVPSGNFPRKAVRLSGGDYLLPSNPMDGEVKAALAEHEANPSAARPWTEVRAELEAKLRRR